MNTSQNLFFPKTSITGTTKVPDQPTAVSTAAVSATGYTNATAGGGGVSLVYLDVQIATVRCRWDGTDPTGSVGHVMAVGSQYTWPVSQWDAARFIRDTGATVDAVVYGSAMNV